MGEKVLTVPPNRIPKALLKAAGSRKKQTQFLNTLQMLREVKPGGASASDLRKVFGITLKAAEEAGMSPNTIDALRKMGPERVFKAGPASVARVYDIATKESSARRLLRWATKGDPKLTGKKWLGTGPTQNLAADVRAQLDELEGMAKTKVSEEVASAKGVFGKAKAAGRAGAARAGEAARAGGLTAAEGGTLGELTRVGAKGLGRGAKVARGLGGLGTMLTLPILGYEAYDSLVGKSKRARVRPGTLTSSESGTGVDLGSSGVSPGEMNELLDQLLGQMQGM
jgi:hypothetical protein